MVRERCAREAAGMPVEEKEKGGGGGVAASVTGGVTQYQNDLVLLKTEQESQYTYFNNAANN